MVVPPAQLVLDTSFVVEALIVAQPRHPECHAFLAYVMQAGSRVHFNRLLELELWEAVYRIALKELRPGKRVRNVRHEPRALRRANALREEVETGWHEVLAALDAVSVDLGEVAAWVPQMMARGVSSYDAVHAATAIYVGVRPLVTLDYHFSLVPEATLELLVPRNRVRACRDQRGRSGQLSGGRM
jgi:predicted nucleic acid-binding protein